MMRCRKLLTPRVAFIRELPGHVPGFFREPSRTALFFARAYKQASYECKKSFLTIVFTNILDTRNGRLMVACQVSCMDGYRMHLHAGLYKCARCICLTIKHKVAVSDLLLKRHLFTPSQMFIEWPQNGRDLSAL